MKTNKYMIIAFLILTSFFLSCSNDLDISDAKYEPKIVIDGYIYPNHKVDNIVITKNIPINTNVDSKSILITDAKVTITDLEYNKTFSLVYSPQKFYYEYPGNDLIIDYGKSYKLEVNAIIDGKQLYASSTTTVPKNGFQINGINADSMKYRESNQDGTLKNFYIDFNYSKDASFYVFSIIALDASFKTFIWDNAYFKIDSTDLSKRFDNYKFQSTFLLNASPTAINKLFRIEWLDIWFYGNYRMIIYATDINFKDFFLTHKRVQEPDGNFHEPKMHIEGDGIGVFGSAVADTIYFKVYK